MPRSALGLIETSGIDGALRATHAASNSGQVVIVSAEQSTGGRMTVKIEGEWAAVQSAIEAGARAAFVAGELMSMHVIPRPDEGVTPILPYSRFVDRYRPQEHAQPKKATVAKPSARVKSAARVPRRVEASTPGAAARQTEPALAVRPTPGEGPAGSGAPVATDQPTRAELEQMAVVKLRHYARTISELPIKGREISKANKQQLLDAIASVRRGE
jgi:ethanolamine utilization protein EutM